MQISNIYLNKRRLEKLKQRGVDITNMQAIRDFIYKLIDEL